MLKEEFNSSLLPFWISILESNFRNPLLEESCFVHFGSCEHGFSARSISLDPAREVYALPPLSAILAGYLFYLVVYGFCPFCCQGGPFYFVVFSLFLLSFLVAIC